MMRSDIHTTFFNIENDRKISCIVLKGLAPDEEIEGPPIHFIVLLDQSGSMANHDRLKNAIKSIQCALDLMKERDIFTLVTFDTVIEHRIRRLALTPENKVQIRTLLSTLVPRENTHLSGALSAIHDIMEQGSSNSISSSSASSPTYKNGVFLLTDGEPTAGVRDIPGLREHVRVLMDRYPDLTITTAGYGEGHNAILLQDIATVGNGSYNIVNNLEQVATVFGDVLGGLRTCLIQQARILVPVATVQLTKFAERVLGDQKEIVMGDIIAGSETTVVLEGLPTQSLEPTAIVLKGADVITGVPFTNMIIMDSLTSERQQQGLTAFLRTELANFVERTNQAISHSIFGNITTDLQRMGQALLAQLRAQPTSPLITFLIGECERTLRFITIPPPPMLIRTTSNQMSQHSAALGTGRGILSIPVGDPTAIAIFSSPTQRHQSETMRMSSGAYDDDDRDTPYPYSATAAPGGAGGSNVPPSPVLRRS
jgi:hypothetical protein